METSNLDGETSLKPRRVISVGEDIDANDFLKNCEFLEVDAPNKSIYYVNGRAWYKKDYHCFDVNNVLLRGTVLKNTEYVIGIAIYTGNDTKIMKNFIKENYKISFITEIVNQIIVYIMVIMIVFCVICGVISTILYRNSYKNKNHIFYLVSNRKEESALVDFLIDFGGYFIIFNNIIPICLMIVLEVVRTLQVYIISTDQELGKHKFKLFSLKLQENLGNIKYIFSDKTGTLTKNKMLFKACSINGKIFFHENAEEGHSKPPQPSFFDPGFDKKDLLRCFQDQIKFPKEFSNLFFNSMHEVILFFFLDIVLNNSILIEKYDKLSPKGRKYQGESPDEIALVESMNEIGVELVEKDIQTKIVSINIFGILHKYKILQSFEFTSSRAKSSVIVRDLNRNEDVIYMFIKGSDSKIMSSLSTSHNYTKTIIQTEEHLSKFAKNGLRTLCYSMKFISESQYSTISSYLKENPNDTKYIETIEGDSCLLGVTGLEDKLQSKVKEDILDYLDAGINVWMVTGDKMDTAESIAYSCGLFSEGIDVYKLSTKENELLSTLENIKHRISETKEELEFCRMERKKRKIFNAKLSIEKKRHRSAKVQNKSQHLIALNSKLNEMQRFKSTVMRYTNNQITENFQENANGSNDKEINDRSIIQFIYNNNYFSNANSNNKNLNAVLKNMIYQSSGNNNLDSKSNMNLQSQEDCVINFDEMKKNIRKRILNLNVNTPKSNSHSDIQPKYSSNSLINNYVFPQTKDFGLLLEGNFISLIISKDESIIKKFIKVISHCQSVVCCRCSPIQKSELISLVKSYKKEGSILSIGDGGNDVSMIRTADIGIGIFGKEGSQAAYNSDYAITKFSQMKRLLFNHGRTYLKNNSYFIYYFFYKSLIYSLPHFWSIFHNLASGTMLYDDFFFMMYNSFSSNVLVAVHCLAEEDIDIDFFGYPNREEILKLVSDIYKENRDELPFTKMKFGLMLLGSLVQSAILYYFTIRSLDPYYSLDRGGHSPCFWVQSFVIYLNVIIYQTAVFIIDTLYWNIFVIFGLSFHIFCNLVVVILRASLTYTQVGKVAFEFMGTSKFWLCLINIAFIGILPYYIIKRGEMFYVPRIVNSIRSNKYEYDIKRKKMFQEIRQIEKVEKIVNKFKRIYYSEEVDDEKDVRCVNDDKLKEIVDMYKNERKN